MPVKTIFSGRKLYQARLRAGLSQEDLAVALRQRTLAKTGPRNVRRWETGETTPHSGLIPAIAATLEISVDELYGDGSSDDDEEDDPSVLLRDIQHLPTDLRRRIERALEARVV